MNEITKINKSFITAVQNKKFPSKLMEEEDPHIEIESQMISKVGYHYNIWKLKIGSKAKRICVRCAVHSFNKATNEYMNLYALSEYNSKRQQWSKDLDTDTPAVFNREIADNANKFARWTVQSLLAGVSKMRFGFVQTKQVKNDR